MTRLGWRLAVMLVTAGAVASSLQITRARAQTTGSAMAVDNGAVADAATSLAPSPRVALLIGNITYRYKGSLPLVANDLDDMHELLVNAGFQVEMRPNLDLEGLRNVAAETLPRLLREAADGTFLLYYSGHGMTVDGENHVIPVDARAYDGFAKSQTMALNEFFQPIRKAMAEKALLALVILDMCRSDEFVKGWGSSKGTFLAGATQFVPPHGVLVMSASQPGQNAGADDGVRNSVYTGQLKKFLTQPGIMLSDSLAKTGAAVKKLTNNNQTPWLEGDPSLGAVMFRAAEPSAAETKAIERSRRQGTVEGYIDYLKNHPKGFYAKEAVNAIERLNLVGRPPALQAPAASASFPTVPETTKWKKWKPYIDQLLDERGQAFPIALERIGDGCFSVTPVRPIEERRLMLTVFQIDQRGDSVKARQAFDVGERQVCVGQRRDVKASVVYVQSLGGITLGSRAFMF